MSAMSERVSSGAAGKQLGVSGGDLRRAGYTKVTTVAYAAAGTGGGPLSCWLAALAALAALAKQT